MSKHAPLYHEWVYPLKDSNDRDPSHLSCFATCSLRDRIAESNELKLYSQLYFREKIPVNLGESLRCLCCALSICEAEWMTLAAFA